MLSFACTINEGARRVKGPRALETISSNAIFETIRQAQEFIRGTLRLQAEQIDKLAQVADLLRSQHRETHEEAQHLLEPIAQTLAEQGGADAPSLQSLAGSIRNLTAAANPGQIFESLAAEAAQMNVRAAVFEVRGLAAWGSSAGGFGSDVSNQDLKSLVVPLNQDNPFRQVFETAQALETRPDGFIRNRNLLEILQPSPEAHILLFPVHSADAVTAILYAVSDESDNSALKEALGILTEFAGAQLDRLMARSTGYVTSEAEHVPGPETPAEIESGAQAAEAESEPGQETAPDAELQPSLQAEPNVEPNAGTEDATESPPSPESQETITAEPAPAAEQAPEPAEESEEVQTLRRDAQRFSKLLVSEIVLYNKEMVAEGRKNKDLYQRLRKDIDRSRQTYEKRFGNTEAKRIDYFHEELLRVLAENDPSLFGSDYPGPSV